MNYLLSALVFLLFSIGSSLLRADTEGENSITWELEDYKKELIEYVPTYRVKFVGTNNSNFPVTIISAKPDCFSCINIAVNPTTVGVGQNVEVTGDVILNPLYQGQSGRIALGLEGEENPLLLSYSIRYPSPYQVSVKELVWGSDRNPKEFILFLDKNSGYEYLGNSIDGDDFKVEEITISSTYIKIRITPMMKNRTRGIFSFRLKKGAESIEDAAPVVLRVEGESTGP